MTTALDELIAKVEAGGALSIDNVGDAINHPKHILLALNAHNGSLDAALALHNAVLPKRYWRVEEWDGAWTAQIPVSASKQHEATSEHSPARSWLLAILRAISEDSQ